ncbi:hypothetical protein [Pseudoduganella umbonata]|uniref:Uncharacterized protein n=1 Tax=Pseudoduganella umbonata TaxID=864828 RepID=A0A4P8HJF4_9BURK|nr:hypothetical protein [Pseudoduganella umbonata]MBB3219611.1 hypothetical protein [Pseudoduganella umbonata]QCP09677.1 hypothetical protein FCL38_04000 [Pseudoduganella umbonata]
MQETRKDELTAQKVHIAMIFREMLGPDDARAYLHAENVPEPVIERVVSGETTRLDQEPDPPATAPPPLPDLNNIFYGSSGRRRNTVKAAIVEAALTVSKELGRDRAEQLLRREALPDDVIARVLAEDGAGRRARSPL